MVEGGGGRTREGVSNGMSGGGGRGRERERERERDQKGSSQNYILGHEVCPLLNIGYLLSLFRVCGPQHN